MGLFYADNGDLCFGEEKSFSLLRLASSRSSPFYAYDVDGMRSRVRALKAAYPGIQPHYAMKANGSPRLLHTFREEGTGVDVVSAGEIRIALKNGFQPADVIFSGVGKTKAELELAIGLGIKQINVESPQELQRIQALAKAMGKKPRIAFRINPDVDAKTHPYITTGFRENKFGMGEHFFPELKEILRQEEGRVELCGLTLHIGSQLLDISPIEDAIRIALRAFADFSASGYPMRTLDVGGGVGIRYQEEHRMPPRDLELLAGYGEMLRRVLRGFPGQLLCEPGRILVGSCGVLVGEVQYVKETPFRNFLIVNTGMHHLLRPALYQAQHRILPLKRQDGRQIRRYDVVGPICESSDVLGKDREMPEVRQGEFLAVADSGAYGYSMASSYNEHPFPEEVFWENGILSSADKMSFTESPVESGMRPSLF
jgi:diaminopimelate decarboxylase